MKHNTNINSLDTTQHDNSNSFPSPLSISSNTSRKALRHLRSAPSSDLQGKNSGKSLDSPSSAAAKEKHVFEDKGVLSSDSSDFDNSPWQKQLLSLPSFEPFSESPEEHGFQRSVSADSNQVSVNASSVHKPNKDVQKILKRFPDVDDDVLLEELLFQLFDLGVRWKLYNPIPCLSASNVYVSLKKYAISSKNILSFPIKSFNEIDHKRSALSSIQEDKDIFCRFLLLKSKIRIKGNSSKTAKINMKLRSFKLVTGYSFPEAEKAFEEKDILRVMGGNASESSIILAMSQGKDYKIQMYNEKDKDSLIEIIHFCITNAWMDNRDDFRIPDVSLSNDTKTTSTGSQTPQKGRQNSIRLTRALLRCSLCYHQTPVKLCFLQSANSSMKLHMMIFADRILFYSHSMIRRKGTVDDVKQQSKAQPTNSKLSIPIFVIPLERILRIKPVSDFRLTPMEIANSFVLEMKQFVLSSQAKRDDEEASPEIEKLTIMCSYRIERKRCTKLLQEFLDQKRSESIVAPKKFISRRFRGISLSMNDTIKADYGPIPSLLSSEDEELQENETSISDDQYFESKFSGDDPAIQASLDVTMPSISEIEEYMTRKYNVFTALVPTQSEWLNQSTVSLVGRTKVGIIDSAVTDYENCVKRFSEVMRNCIVLYTKPPAGILLGSCQPFCEESEEVIRALNGATSQYFMENREALLDKSESFMNVFTMRTNSSFNETRAQAVLKFKDKIVLDINPSVVHFNRYINQNLDKISGSMKLVFTKPRWFEMFRIAIISRLNSLLDLDSAIHRWLLLSSRSSKRFAFVSSLEEVVKNEEELLFEILQSLPSHEDVTLLKERMRASVGVLKGKKK